jgi:hypothetical protein
MEIYELTEYMNLNFEQKNGIYYYKSFEIYIVSIFNEIEIKNIMTGNVSDISFQSLKRKEIIDFINILDHIHRDIAINVLNQC